MNKSKYIVVEQFHGLGRMHKIGGDVELTDDQAAELAGLVKPADGSAMPAATNQDASHQERIAELEEQIGNLNLQLGKECEAKHEYKNALDTALQQLTDIQAENEQLKAAAAAKPAAKGAK